MKDISTIQIGDQLIGNETPTYIIAEIGINHNGDATLAKRLIDAAAEARVNAVKLQKRHLPSLYREDVLNHTIRYEQNFQYMIPILREVELDEEVYFDLSAYCREKGVEFLCTPFDRPSVDFLERLGVKAYKTASADLNNLELLKYISSKGKPMIVSTGMSYWNEIEKAVQLLNSLNTPFALLHCRSVYPVWPREVNLRMINRLRKFGRPVGYSGHDIGIIIPLVAASMGACIIEKHITLDKTMHGPDHKISLEPFELKRLVRDIRIADQAMGKHKRFLLRGEILNRELFGKSLTAACDIPAGTIVTLDRIRVQGPGKGLSPSRLDELIGKTASRDLKKNDFFLDEDIDGPCPRDFENTFRSRWGLISRFSDFDEIIGYNPKVLEFHLAERDFHIPFDPSGAYSQELIVHAPEYMGDHLLDLCSEDEGVRQQSVALAQKSIELARTLGPHFSGRPKVIVHPGAMSLNTKLDPEKLALALHKSLLEINAKDITLLLENLPPYPWYFGGQWKGNYFMEAHEIRSFCEDSGIRICFDISHAALYCNAKDEDLGDYIRTVMPWIHHIHFADAYGLDGEGMQIGEGDIDFKGVMPLFSEYQGTWVPEIWRGHLAGGRGFIEALNKLREYDL